MCPDPRAVAMVEVRAALAGLESYLRHTATRKTEVSATWLERLAVLRTRLDWCSECYSRRRSRLLLARVIRELAELTIRVIETLPRVQSVVRWSRWRIDAVRRCHPNAAWGVRALAAGVGAAA